MAKNKLEKAIEAVQFLDGEYGLMIGDFTRPELETVKKVIDMLLKLDDRTLQQVNVNSLRVLINNE